MMHLNFALAIYPQRKGERNSPYERKAELREESWGLLKVLLGTTYAHLEEDLNTLAFPADLHIATYDDALVRLYECRALKYSSGYQEVKRMHDTVQSLSKVPHMCVESIGIHHGKTMFHSQVGHHSNILTTIHQIQVNL